MNGNTRNYISISSADIYPVNLYGTVNTPWLYALRRQIWTKDRAITDYTLDRIAKNSNPNEGHCYLFRGGFRTIPMPELAGFEVPKVKLLQMQGVISAFMSVGGTTRNLTFIPDKVECDVYKQGYDMLSVRAHDTFAETGDLLALNTTIKKKFPKFCIDWMDQYPRIDIMPVQKGMGDSYAEVLNASVLWSAVTFSNLCIEMGEDTYTVDLK